MRLIIKNGHVLDPGNLDQVADVVIEDGVIKAIETNLSRASDQTFSNARVHDAKGCYVVPGLIDMHVRGEPGQEYKETIETGLKAAAAAVSLRSAACPIPCR
ncbi:MAG: hypothetical protein R2874_01270 [Desulfobacterales bacterium]